MKMNFPKADVSTQRFFEEVVPKSSNIKLRPMFGHAAAFVNGHMFSCTLGTQIVVRLKEEDRTLLLHEDGASFFEPIKGRKMKEYIVLPKSWRQEPEKVRDMMSKSLAWVTTFPPKVKKPPTRTRNR